jgi:transposase-like protein
MRSISTEVVDGGSKRDSRRRRVTDQPRRTELLAAYDRSGLTQKAFAQREGVNVHTFVSWLQQHRRALATTATPPPVQFAELPWSGARSAGLEVVLPDGVTVRGAIAAEVAALVRLLRG